MIIHLEKERQEKKYNYFYAILLVFYATTICPYGSIYIIVRGRGNNQSSYDYSQEKKDKKEKNYINNTFSP